MREASLRELEERRPRQFGGMDGKIAKGLVLDYLSRLEQPARRSLLMGCMSGAVWTADRAHRRKLRDSPQCPYCAVPGLAEDEDHIFWQCSAWEDVREAPRRKLAMLASRVTTLPREVAQWPSCLRVCGLPPQSAMEALSPELRTLFMDSLLDLMGAGGDGRCRVSWTLSA